MFSFIFKFLLFHLSGKSHNKIVIIVTEILSLSLTLYVFSVGGKLVDQTLVQEEAQNYFYFLLVGEIALILPISFLETIIRNFLEFYQTQFLQTLKGNQISFYPLLLQKSLAELFYPFLRVILMFVLSFFLFSASFSFLSLLGFILTQGLALISMGILSRFVIQFYENYGRGLKMVYMFNSILAVLGGAYFPVRFLPSIVKDYLVWLFPQTIILQISRMSFQSLNEKYLYSLSYFGAYLLIVYFLVKGLIRWLEKRRLTQVLGHMRFS